MTQSIFDQIIEGRLPASVVWRDERCIAFMDIHPMARGHVLVCPLQAVVTLDALDDEIRAHLFNLAVRIGRAQRAALGSIAQHLLVNDGPGASQTVPHVHLHVIPRYRGDRFATVARIIRHIAVLGLAPPISSRRRRQLDEQACAIAAALGSLDR